MPASRNGVPRKAKRVRRVRDGRSSSTVVTVDFETYYDKDYTLKKLSTSEYIRDDRFEVLCAGIKVGRKATRVYFGKSDVREALLALDWTRLELLAHHAHFEGLVLFHHFGVLPGKYRDTLSMSRGLFPRHLRHDLDSLSARLGLAKLSMPDFKGVHLSDMAPEMRRDVARYCRRDVDICREAYDALHPGMPEEEMELIDITVRMFAEPKLVLDEPLAEEALREEMAEREGLIGGSGARDLAAGLGLGAGKSEEELLSSNAIFPQLLEALDVEVPRKISKTTLEETDALAKGDEKFAELLEHEDDRVVNLVRGRLAAKSTIGTTRATRLLRSGAGGRGLPVYLNYCGAHTTRWSGGDKMNYQNLRRGSKLRRSLMAPPGQVIVVLDSRQIEARITAWLAREEWLLESFRSGGDPYSEFASRAFGRTVTKADKLERFVGKTCVLGLGYGMGASKLRASILAQSVAQGLPPVKLDLRECQKLVNVYRGTNTRIVALWEELEDVVRGLVNLGRTSPPLRWRCLEYGNEFIRLPGHLSIFYPEAKDERESHDVPRGFASEATFYADDGLPFVQGVAQCKSRSGYVALTGRLLTENVVQYLARIVVAKMTLQISRRYRVVLMTHDDVGFLADEREAQHALDFAMEIMRTPPGWAPDLPIDAEGSFDRCYSK